jgi:hypothetical protein
MRLSVGPRDVNYRLGGHCPVSRTRCDFIASTSLAIRLHEISEVEEVCGRVFDGPWPSCESCCLQQTWFPADDQHNFSIIVILAAYITAVKRLMSSRSSGSLLRPPLSKDRKKVGTALSMWIRFGDGCSVFETSRRYSSRRDTSSVLV